MLETRIGVEVEELDWAIVEKASVEEGVEKSLSEVVKTISGEGMMMVVPRAATNRLL